MKRKRILTCVCVVLVVLLAGKAGAETLDINGSFAKQARNTNVNALLNKGFILGFDEFNWIEGWQINAAMSAGYFLLKPVEDQPQGGRILHVLAEKGPAHLFWDKLFPARLAYTVSFQGRIKDGEPGNISICVYEFSQTASGFRKIRTVQNFKLSEPWQTFECVIPAETEYMSMRLVFSFTGSCSLTDIQLESE